MRKELWLLGLSLYAIAAPAVAQSEIVVVSSSEIRTMPASVTEARQAELEQAYKDARSDRPRRGVIISSVLLAGGAGLLGGGIYLSRLCFSPSPCPNTAGVGAATVGATIVVGSVIGLAISSVRLRRAKEGRAPPPKKATLP